MDANNDGIDDRWIQLAAQHLREIEGANTAIRDATNALQRQQERLATATNNLNRVKAAISDKAPFVELPKK